jgi:hypothetical protein
VKCVASSGLALRADISEGSTNVADGPAPDIMVANLSETRSLSHGRGRSESDGAECEAEDDGKGTHVIIVRLACASARKVWG